MLSLINRNSVVGICRKLLFIFMIFSIQQPCSVMAESRDQIVASQVPFQIFSHVRWGMSQDEVLASPGIRRFYDSWSEKQVIGFTNVSISGVSFPAIFEYDDNNFNRSAVGSNYRTMVPQGLNHISLFASGTCMESDYFKIKNDLSARFPVEQPEQITGETDLKNRTISYEIPSGHIRLQSRCDNPYEKYRWLVIDIFPGFMRNSARGMVCSEAQDHSVTCFREPARGMVCSEAQDHSVTCFRGQN